MSFHVGQKVVCVDVGYNSALVLDAIYEITAIDPSYFPQSRQVGLQVAGPMKRPHAFLFYARRFRPLVTRKTDIGIFTEILRKVGGRVDA